VVEGKREEEVRMGATLLGAVLSPLYHGGTFGLHDFICLAVLAVLAILFLFTVRGKKDQPAEEGNGTRAPEAARPDEE
jgi:hypothetical protein